VGTTIAGHLDDLGNNPAGNIHPRDGGREAKSCHEGLKRLAPHLLTNNNRLRFNFLDIHLVLIKKFF